MTKLEKRYYTRAELAEILEIKENDSHFARKVKETLTKYGYEYKYSCKGVDITYIPTTIEEQIKEIALRRFGIDVQTAAAAFSTFFYLLSTQFEYQSCPWTERVKMLKECEGIDICEKTLRNWTNILIKQNLIVKDIGNREAWRTYYHPTEYEFVWDPVRMTTVQRKKKVQEPLTSKEDFDEMSRYWKDLFQYKKDAEENPKLCEVVNKVTGEVKQITPNQYAAKRVWKEYGCCYYYCKPFIFNAFQDEEIKHLFDLIEDNYLNGEYGNNLDKRVLIEEKKEVEIKPKEFIF